MSTCNPADNPYNATQSHISCDGAIDPLGGATIPEDIVAVEVFVGDGVFWDLDPEQPSETLPTLLVNQSSGGILIEEGLYLAIV